MIGRRMCDFFTTLMVAGTLYSGCLTPVEAQWQVPAGNIPIGRGPGIIGFNSSTIAGLGFPITPQQYGAVGNGIANDTVAVTAALAAAKGSQFGCVPGSTYLTDPFKIDSTNSPSIFNCYGATFKQRSGATATITIENPQNATGFTGLTINGLSADANFLGAQGILVHGLQPPTAGNIKSISIKDVSVKNATGCGWKVLGEPSFGVYSNSFSNIHSASNGTGFCDQSINNTGNNYTASNQYNNTFADGNTSAGYFLDYSENTWNNPRAEGTTAGPGMSFATIYGTRIVGGHMENNLLAAVNTDFVGVPGSSKGIKIYGTNTSGTITGLNGFTGNTIDVACATCVSGVTDGFNANFMLTQGIGINSGARILDTINGGSGGGLHLAFGGTDGLVITSAGATLPASQKLRFTGVTSGTLDFGVAAIAGTSTITWPAGTTNFSATGGANQVLQQVSAGGAFTVGQLACASLSTAGTACAVNTGTTGHTIPFLDGSSVFSGSNVFQNPTATPGQRIQFDSADASPTAINNQTLTISNYNTTNNNYNTIMFTSKDNGGNERAGGGMMGVYTHAAAMVQTDLIFFTREIGGAVDFPMYMVGKNIILGSSASASFPAMKPTGTTLDVRLGDDSAAAPIGASAHISKGTVPVGTTGSCVASSFTGGATAGKFSAAVCAAGTIILSSLPTAPNGYTCNAQDQTTVANTLKQSANTVTSVTFTSTTTAADVVVFQCMAW